MITCFAFAGILAGNMVAPSTTVALHPCQDDECEESIIWGDYCQDNPGGGTYCNFVGEDCLTRACGHDDGDDDVGFEDG